MKFSKLKKPIKADLSILEDKVQPIEEMARPKKQMPTEEGQPEEHVELEKVPEFHASGSSMTQTIDMFEDIFRNMKNKRDSNQHPGIILTGDPGTGKTSRIKLLSKLLGVNIITVEAPHIIEEHIINIPFIVFDAETGREKTGSTKVKGDDYKVVLADSNLYSQLKSNKVVSDEQHLKDLYKNNTKDIIELYEALGGTQERLPKIISEVRKQFNVILFLDEYFRQTSMRIRNMLRGILNNKIGAHDIPKNVYIIYATNLEDEGIEGEIPRNNEFKMLHVENPTKAEWFSWLVYKFEKDKHIHLNNAVINRFHHILDDEHISYNDAFNEVRISPRRWEQLLLYINSSLPVKDEKDAIGLLTNVKLNFKNYLTGSHSDLAQKVLKALAQLIKETSGIEVSHNASHADADWRETLRHQIQSKKKIGEARSYVPVISGLPGLGKTAQAEKVAHEENLRFIDIDVSTINAEDVVGIPVAKTGEEGEMETAFSIPSLYYQINKRIKEADKEYFDHLKKEDPDNFEEKKKEYSDQKYKYLIFFDELNRNSPKVFNAIRRILLEKNFGPAGDGKGKLLELPKEAMMLGAINPHDAGAQELTAHMRDVLDIIETGPKWESTLKYMKSEVKMEGVSDQARDLTVQTISRFADKFKTKDPDVEIHRRQFFIEAGGQPMYISPREYTTLYKEMARLMEDLLEGIKDKFTDELTQEEMTRLENRFREKVYKELVNNMNFTFVKHGQHGQNQDFLKDLKVWFMASSDLDFFDSIFKQQAFDFKKNSLSEILSDHFDGKEAMHAHEHDDFIGYIDNADTSKFAEDLDELIRTKINDEKSLKHYIIDKKANGKEINDKNRIVNGTTQVSIFTNFVREVLYSLIISHQSFDKIDIIRKIIGKAIRQIINSTQDLDPDIEEQVTSAMVNGPLAETTPKAIEKLMPK